MLKWVFASSCCVMLSGAAMGQVIFEPPVTREFVDHPYNPRLNSDAVERLRSLQEPAGQDWAQEEIYIRSDGRRVWPVERPKDRFGNRQLLSNRPLYFRKSDLLPREDTEWRDEIEAERGARDERDEMVDVRELAEPPATSTAPATRPAATTSAGNLRDLPPGSIVIIPAGSRDGRASDNGDRVSD